MLLLADRWRAGRPARRPARATVLAFSATGLLNGVALMLTYAALQSAPVAVVAPIVSAYPLVTLALGAALLREETVNARVAAGAVLTLACVVFLVVG